METEKKPIEDTQELLEYNIENIENNLNKLFKLLISIVILFGIIFVTMLTFAPLLIRSLRN